MKEFLEQLGFEDITSDNFFMKYSLNEYFDWNKVFNTVYKRVNDNGITTYIMYGTEGNIYHVGIISKCGHKWRNAYQFAPSKYIKEVTFDLLILNEAIVLRL